MDGRTDSHPTQENSEKAHHQPQTSKSPKNDAQIRHKGQPKVTNRKPTQKWQKRTDASLENVLFFLFFSIAQGQPARRTVRNNRSIKTG
jgi:hypothetical protein